MLHLVHGPRAAARNASKAERMPSNSSPKVPLPGASYGNVPFPLLLAARPALE